VHRSATQELWPAAGALGRIRAVPRQHPEDGGMAAFLPSLQADAPDRN